MMISLWVEKEEECIEEAYYCEQLIECLQVTFPQFCIDFPIERIFTKTELNLLNNIANSYAQMGDVEKAIKILKQVVLYFNQIQIIDDYDEYGMALLSLANKLGLCGRHQESILVCEKGIEWLRKNGRSNYLYNFLYDIAWNNTEVCKIEKNEDKQLQAKQLIIQAYYTAAICDESEINLNIIERYYKKNYS